MTPSPPPPSPEGNALNSGTELTRLNLLFERASQLAGIGGWEYDVVSGEIFWTDLVRRIHEVGPEFQPNIESGINFYKEGESREAITEAVRLAIEKFQSWDLNLELVTARGREIWVRTIGEPLVENGVVTKLLGTFEDIDLQYSRERGVQEHIVRLEDALAAVKDFGLIGTDTRGLINLFNRGAELLLGYLADEVIGTRALSAFHIPEEIEVRGAELSGELGRAVCGFEVFTSKPSLEGSETREWTCVRKDGTHVSVRLTLTPNYSRDGTLNGYVGIARDISLRRAAEAALKESEMRWQFALTSAGDGLWDWSLADDTVFYSAQWIEMLGHREGEIGNSFSEWESRIHPDDLAGWQKALAEYFAGQTDLFTIEYRLRCADGYWKWILTRGKIINRSVSDIPLRIIGTNTDLTHDREMEIDLRRALKRVDLATQAGGVGIWEWNVATNKLLWDEQMFRLYGKPKEEFTGEVSDWERALHREDRQRAVAEIAAALRGENEFDTRFRILRPDGEVRYIRGRAFVERSVEGDPVLMTGTNWDITDSMNDRARLAELAKQAGEASEAKSVFLAKMSHEIRTPMNGVIGITHLLLDSIESTGEQREYAKLILESAESLQALLNDALDLSKVEAGKMELEEIPFDFHEWFESALAMSAAKAAQSGLLFQTNIRPEVPEHVVGDPVRLRQVLLNLTSNALKFTPEGSIRVEVGVIGHTDGEVLLEFSVADSGIGIKAEDQARLFEPFTQAENSTTRQFGGTGLGLAICRKITELFGGEISLSSEWGKGATFLFTVRLKVAEGKMKSESKPAHRGLSSFIDPRLAGEKSVLVVEDNAVNRVLVTKMLGRFGFRSDEVTNGLEAVEAARRKHYDVILMDVEMPVLDGRDATRLIRESSDWLTPCDVPILALTANARREDRDQCLAVGMSEYLTKPLAPGDLAAALVRACRLPGPTPAADP